MAALIGVGFAAVIFMGVLGLVISVPSRHSSRASSDTEKIKKPHEVHYTLRPSADGTSVTLDLVVLNERKETLHQRAATALFGRLASFHLGGEVYKADVLSEFPPDGEKMPKLEERTVIESGIVVLFRGDPGKEGLLGSTVKVYLFEKRKMVQSVEANAYVKPGEEQILKLSP
jgi:hypothetical protein